MTKGANVLNQKRIVGGLAATLLGVAALASAAWACSVQPMVLGISPVRAAPGEQVRLEGSGVATAAPLEVHWNSASGPVIGEASADAGRRFDVAVTVPQAEPGIYTLVLVSQVDGSVGRAALEVIQAVASEQPAASGRAATVSNDVWSGLASQEAAVGFDAAMPLERRTGLPVGMALAGVGAVSLLSLLIVAGRRTARSRD